MKRQFRSFFLLLSALLPIVSCSSQAADFNQVGREMARLLENGHYAQLQWNEGLSRRFLDEYIESLDPYRRYFLKTDIDEFKEKYADQVTRKLRQADFMDMAVEVFDRYRTRVRERVSDLKEILANEKFDFTKNESLTVNREDMPWFKDAAEARKQWRLSIKEDLLSEQLRREQIAKRAKEQGKEDPLKDEADPRKKIQLRYDRQVRFAEEADREDIANYFLSAVARAYDPHSDYMSHREEQQFRIGVSNELVGIGAVLKAEDDGATKIDGVVNGGPADKQGELQLGDRVVAVDSLNNGEWVDIMFMSLDKVVEMIRGKEGTTVALKVEPAGGAASETKIITIERDVVTMKDSLATGEIYELIHQGQPHRIGFLRIPSFYFGYGGRTKSVSADVERIVERFNKENVDGLLIDLRGNGGGSLEEVRRLTGFFVGAGPVVQIKRTSGHIEALSSDSRKPLYTGPLGVLVDKGSASASEILAGALQDYNRAVIIGNESTYGKGTVQQPANIGRFMPFLANRERAGTAKLTIQKFYRVSGDSTQKKGVVPDIIFPSTNDALEVGEAHQEFALPFDRIRQAGNFNPRTRKNLFVPMLRNKSESRQAKNPEFQYVKEDIKRIEERIAKNKSSLNREKRLSEIEENNARRKARNKARIKRFAKIEKEDAKMMKIYRLTLDDVNADELPLVDRERDEERHMRRVEDKLANLDDTPEWPNGIDAELRESLNIMLDLVDAVKEGKLAGVIKER